MTHKQAVLKLLSDRKPHSHIEMYDLRVIGHSRVNDLRRDGYRIDHWLKDGLHWYQLNGRLDDGAGAGLASSSSTPSNRSPKREAASPLAPASDDPTAPDGGVLTLVFDEPDQAFICEVDESAGLRGSYWEPDAA